MSPGFPGLGRFVGLSGYGWTGKLTSLPSLGHPHHHLLADLYRVGRTHSQSGAPCAAIFLFGGAPRGEGEEHDRRPETLATRCASRKECFGRKA